MVSQWLGLLASTVFVWVGGSVAVPYALVLFALLAFTSLVTIAYAHRLGVAVQDRKRVVRLRLIPYTVVAAVLILGMARSGAFPRSLPFLTGLAVGGLAALTILALHLARGRRRERAAAQDPQ